MGREVNEKEGGYTGGRGGEIGEREEGGGIRGGVRKNGARKVRENRKVSSSSSPALSPSP